MNYIYLFIILLIIKLAGLLKISWWLVTLPLWIWPLLIAFLFIAVIIIPLLGMVAFVVGAWIALAVISAYEATRDYLKKRT